MQPEITQKRNVKNKTPPHRVRGSYIKGASAKTLPSLLPQSRYANCDSSHGQSPWFFVA